MRLRLSAIALLVISCTAAPSLPPAAGLEVVTQQAIVDVSKGETTAELGIPDAPIGAVRHGEQLFVIGTGAVWSVDPGDVRSVHEFEDPMLHVQIATSDATSVVLVHPAERNKPSELLVLDGELSAVAEADDQPWLVGIGPDGAILEDRGELIGVGSDGDRAPTGVRIDTAIGFAGTDRVLTTVNDELTIIDLEGTRTEVTGIEDARLSHGVASPDGSRVVALLTSSHEIDDENQLRSLGMWMVSPDGTAELIDDSVGNDDAIVAIDRGGEHVYVILAEGRPRPELVAMSLADGSTEPMELPPASVPVDWSLPALSMLLLDADSR